MKDPTTNIAWDSASGVRSTQEIPATADDPEVTETARLLSALSEVLEKLPQLLVDLHQLADTLLRVRS